MSDVRSYESDALAAIHEMAEDLHEAGLLGEATMRRFDETCLTRVLSLDKGQEEA